MRWFSRKRVVVPFDFSPESLEALRVGLALAEKPGDVHLIHVLLELPPTDPASVWDVWNDEKRKQKTQTALLDRLREEDVTSDITTHVTVGVPAREITELAEDLKAGMIVIPSHGYRGLKRFFLGSVAERVVRQANCPVLVLKHDVSEEAAEAA